MRGIAPSLRKTEVTDRHAAEERDQKKTQKKTRLIVRKQAQSLRSDPNAPDGTEAKTA